MIDLDSVLHYWLSTQNYDETSAAYELEAFDNEYGARIKDWYADLEQPTGVDISNAIIEMREQGLLANWLMAAERVAKSPLTGAMITALGASSPAVITVSTLESLFTTDAIRFLPAIASQWSSLLAIISDAETRGVFVLPEAVKLAWNAMVDEEWLPDVLYYPIPPAG